MQIRSDGATETWLLYLRNVIYGNVLTELLLSTFNIYVDVEKAFENQERFRNKKYENVNSNRGQDTPAELKQLK